MTFIKSILLSAILLLTLAVAEAKTITDKQEARSAGSSISSWELSGAMAVRNKNKGWNATINWLQQGAGHYQIRLFGPLGSGSILVKKQGGVVTLQDGKKIATSPSAEGLLRKQTGMSLPVSSLYYWVRGMPAPGHVQSIKRDANNQISVLRQGGYTIEYGQYTNTGKAALPRQVKLMGNGMSIKLAIRNWRV